MKAKRGKGRPETGRYLFRLWVLKGSGLTFERLAKSKSKHPARYFEQQYPPA